MSDQSSASVIPPFENSKNSKQLTHAESLNLFKKTSDPNASKSNVQKTPNNNRLI